MTKKVAFGKSLACTLICVLFVLFILAACQPISVPRTENTDQTGAVVSSTAASSKTNPSAAVVSPTSSNSRDLMNLKYGELEQQTMDVFLPAPKAGTDNAKTILLIHGGAWMSGDKTSFDAWARYLRDQGFAAISINYRLANGEKSTRYPAQIEDMDKAVAYIKSNDSTWHISRQYNLLGHSAGGHLALQYGLISKDSDLHAVVSMAGPTWLPDFRAEDLEKALIPFLGCTYESNPKVWEDASPVSHGNSCKIPVLLMHGKNDIIVPVIQSQKLYDVLSKTSKDSKLRLYDNAGHDFSQINYKTLADEVISWLGRIPK